MAAKKTTGGRKPARKTPVKSKARKTAPRKSSGRKSKSAKKAGKPSLGHELRKIGLGIAILVAICLTAAMVADIFLKSVRPVSPEGKAEKVAGVRPEAPSPPEIRPPRIDGESEPVTKVRASGLMKKTDSPSIVYEVFKGVDPEHARRGPALPRPGEGLPMIAIIIDDIGYDRALAMDLVALDRDLTFAVLPFSPFGKTIARNLSAKGAELMLHLPMEPKEYPRVNPGPGALLSSMSPDAMLDQLRKNIKAVPGAVGVNNHMGSRLTADEGKMNQIFTVLKKQGLFFIDSRTSAASKGEASARLFRLEFSHRDIFLDNFQNREYIKGQLAKLIRAAQKHGHAVGIGHPYQATLDTLKAELPGVKTRVRLVRASRLVSIPG